VERSQGFLCEVPERILWKQGCTIFPLQNYRRQKRNIKLVPYWRPENVRRHRTKFSLHGNLAPGICAALLWRGHPLAVNCYGPINPNRKLFDRTTNGIFAPQEISETASLSIVGHVVVCILLLVCLVLWSLLARLCLFWPRVQAIRLVLTTPTAEHHHVHCAVIRWPTATRHAHY